MTPSIENGAYYVLLNGKNADILELDPSSGKVWSETPDKAGELFAVHLQKSSPLTISFEAATGPSVLTLNKSAEGSHVHVALETVLGGAKKSQKWIVLPDNSELYRCVPELYYLSFRMCLQPQLTSHLPQRLRAPQERRNRYLPRLCRRVGLARGG